MEHELKCWPESFAAILAGTKRHEVRKNDRPFAEGDVLRLLEWVPICGVYTGRGLRVRVTYLTEPGTWGLPDCCCVMSIKLIAEPKPEGGDRPDPRSPGLPADRESVAPAPSAPAVVEGAAPLPVWKKAFLCDLYSFPPGTLDTPEADDE